MLEYYSAEGYLACDRERFGPHFTPSNLIGANGFAGQDHCSRVCGAEHRRAKRALDCDLER
jgi:hypothetical protein